MWQLHMTNATDTWTHEGDFETVKAAAARIRALEGYPVTGIFFEIHVDTVDGNDADSFAQLEHKGRRAAYVVRRRVN